MSIRHITAIFAMAMVLAAPSALRAADATVPAATPAPIINSVCPMDGKPIDMATSPTCPMTIGEGAEAKQYRMAMCSMHCSTEFMKDPAAALKPKFGKDAAGPKTLNK